MSENNFEYLVSVLIITYQQEDYIVETLESVISQDCARMQIVVSDDASSDQTINIVKAYAERYPELVFFVESEKNTGITDNCNRGLMQCRGKYLSVLGGDDIMLSDKLKIQVSYMEAHPDCAVSYHDMEVFESESGEVLNLFSTTSKPRIGGIREAIKFGTVNCASSTMYRMSAVPSQGFKAQLPVVSDWMFTIESLEGGGGLQYIDAILGRYRRHKKNVSHAESPFRLQGQVDLLTTCAICMAKYPRYLGDSFYRLAAIFRESRNLAGGINYEGNLIASLKLRISVKSLVGLFVFYISLRSVRL